jgi:ribosome-associated protein
MAEPFDVPIRDESIRLGQFLKLANLVESGAEAKPVVAEGLVRVNGDVETRRGRQLVKGDVVELRGQQARVADESAYDDLPW